MEAKEGEAEVDEIESDDINREPVVKDQGLGISARPPLLPLDNFHLKHRVREPELVDDVMATIEETVMEQAVPAGTEYMEMCNSLNSSHLYSFPD